MAAPTSAIASASTTGVVAGTTLRPSGSIEITRAGAVVSGLDIRGEVVIDASNVTLRNCRITATSFNAISVLAPNAKIENCEIVSDYVTGGTKGVYFDDSATGGSVRNCDIYRVEDGVYVSTSGVFVENNYIHDLASNSFDPHYDGVQLHGGVSSYVVIRNNLISVDASDNSCITMGTVQNVVMENNLLTGGGYTVRVDGRFGAGRVSEIYMLNNVFGQHEYGYWDFERSSPRHGGNTTEGSITLDDFPSPYSVAVGTNSSNTLWGGATHDVIWGLGSNDKLIGLAGNDRLDGGAGNDTLIGGPGADTLRGGLGRDAYVLEDGTDTISDAGGIDTVTSTISRSIARYTTVENLRLVNVETAVKATGNALNNSITGNNFANVLTGGGGNDRLRGLDGNDVLVGGSGRDVSIGGPGNDVFRFASTSHSAGGLADVIVDFDDFGNDVIDLRAVFGGTLSYIHNAAFTAAGQVRIADVPGPNVVVEVNTGGSLDADMQISLSNTTPASMSRADFLL